MVHIMAGGVGNSNRPKPRAGSILAYGVVAAIAGILAIAEEMAPAPSPQKQPAFNALAVFPTSTHAVPRLSTASNPSNILPKTSLWIHPASSILTWSQE